MIKALTLTALSLSLLSSFGCGLSPDEAATPQVHQEALVSTNTRGLPDDKAPRGEAISQDHGAMVTPTGLRHATPGEVQGLERAIAASRAAARTNPTINQPH